MRSNKLLLKHLLVVTAVVITSFAPVRAQLLVSNLNEANNGGAGTVGMDKWAAQGFQTASTPTTLGSVGLKLAHDFSALGLFTVSLWTASPAGIPGSQIATISAGNPVSSLTTTLVDYTYTAPAGITLAPNTSYFIVLNSTVSASPAGLLWGATQLENPGKTGPGQMGGWAYSTGQGSSWGSDAPFFQDQTASLEFPFQLAITAVPEPQTYALASALALLAFAAARRVRAQVNLGHSCPLARA